MIFRRYLLSDDVLLISLLLEQLRSLQKAYEAGSLSEAAGICNNLGIQYAEIGKTPLVSFVADALPVLFPWRQ